MSTFNSVMPKTKATCLIYFGNVKRFEFFDYDAVGKIVIDVNLKKVFFGVIANESNLLTAAIFSFSILSI